MTARSSYSLRTTSGRFRVFFTPVLLFLAAVVVSPALAELVTLPMMREPNRPSDIAAYVSNDRIHIFALVVIVFCSVVVATAYMRRLEATLRVDVRTHFRQCSLVYVYLLIGATSTMQKALNGAFVMCYVCPPPWEVVAPVALLGNALANLGFARVSSREHS
jgi:hypothetical protein